jgi:hypothetical protein
MGVDYSGFLYAITPNLCRWQIQCGGAQLRCGTAPTWFVAQMEADDVVNA